MRKSAGVYWMISNERKLVVANSKNWKQLTFSDSQDEQSRHSLVKVNRQLVMVGQRQKILKIDSQTHEVVWQSSDDDFND